MPPPDDQHHDADDEALLEWMDPLVDEFESVWLGGEVPVITQHLGDIPDERRAALLRELIFVDLEHRWKRDRPRTIESYLREFPELLGADESLVEELVDHYRELRARYREDATPEERSHRSPPSIPPDSTVHIQCVKCSNRTQLVGAERYETLGEIGRGGLGRVLRVRDLEMNREVALKELLPQTTESRHARTPPQMKVARFLSEAKVTGQLEHPSIPPVYEIGQREDGSVVCGLFEPVDEMGRALIEGERQRLEAFLGGEYLRPRTHTPFIKSVTQE